MTAYPTALHCARCGALDTAHELRTDGRTRGKRLGQTAGSTGNELCAGFVAGEAVELEDAGELRRRLDAVLALHQPEHELLGSAFDESGSLFRDGVGADGHTWCKSGDGDGSWPCPTVRAARGET